MPLGIPLTVARCPTPDRRRVRYKDGVRRVIGENIVLRRWRQRSNEPRARATGETFDGLRLRPGTWTLLLACRRYGLRLDAAIDVERLTRCLEQARRDHPKCRAPHPSKLVHLPRFLRQRRVLRAVAERARNPERPGLPDLFLYRMNGESEMFGARFVEVKRRHRRPAWWERVSAQQREELAFLRSLGLRANVVYLIEDRRR